MVWRYGSPTIIELQAVRELEQPAGYDKREDGVAKRVMPCGTQFPLIRKDSETLLLFRYACQYAPPLSTAQADPLDGLCNAPIMPIILMVHRMTLLNVGR